MRSNTHSILCIGFSGPLGSSLIKPFQDEGLNVTYVQGRELDSWLEKAAQNRINQNHIYNEIYYFGRSHWNTDILKHLKKSPTARFFFASSGAVYLPKQSGGYLESDPLQEYDPKNNLSYSNQKIQVEMDLKKYFTKNSSAQIGSAISLRIFSVMGPGLDLNAPYAWVSFIKSAINGTPIQIQNPDACRSYLSFSDWSRILCSIRKIPSFEPFSAINIGSEESVSMMKLAEQIAALAQIGILPFTEQPQHNGLAPNFYIPVISKLKTILPDLKITPFDSVLKSTWMWYKNNNG